MIRGRSVGGGSGQRIIKSDSAARTRPEGESARGCEGGMEMEGGQGGSDEPTNGREVRGCWGRW